MINKSDRSAANISGWGTRGQTSYNYLAYSGAFESVDALGKVINHELGHYTYGLYDEVCGGRCCPQAQRPGQPLWRRHAQEHGHEQPPGVRVAIDPRRLHQPS